MRIDLEALLRKEAARILDEHLVDVVIGFQAGSMPMTAQPAFVRHSRLVDILVDTGFGATNLALYLTRRRHRAERIGLVCRGCESRAVRVLMREQQHQRDHLYLMGIPCKGIIDRRKVLTKAGPNILASEETDTGLVVTTRDGELGFDRTDVMHDACRRCRFPDPVGVDFTPAEPLPERPNGSAKDEAEAFDSLAPEERSAEFARQAERCIRCYACRQACPMCYCTQCFVDHTAPRWTESTIGAAGTQAWHIMRAFHQAGRCVGCGACERACPMNIRMRFLTDRLNRDMERAYDFVPGREENLPPPFVAFSLEDASRFEL